MRGDQPAVELLGERREVVAAGAQPGLDVHDRDAQVEGRERGGERGAGVAVDEHGCGVAALAHLLGVGLARGDLVEPLAEEVLEAAHHRRHSLVEPRARVATHSGTSAQMPASSKTSSPSGVLPVETTIGRKRSLRAARG